VVVEAGLGTVEEAGMEEVGGGRGVAVPVERAADEEAWVVDGGTRTWDGYGLARADIRRKVSQVECS
jgi:hypothetical protein